MCYVLMKCVIKYVEMVKQNEKVFTAHDFPKRQYFDNILIVFLSNKCYIFTIV